METFSATVRDLSKLGKGVVNHPNGMVFFVDGVWPGDEGEFEVLEIIKKKYGFAKLRKILSRSEQRVEPTCPHTGITEQSCSGCPWMIGEYKDQLKYKEHFIRHGIQKLNINFDFKRLLPIIPSKNIVAYRNRAQFKTDGKKIGFINNITQSISSIDECKVLTHKVNESFMFLKSLLPNQEWESKDFKKWNFIDVDEDTDPTKIILNKRRPFRQGNSDQNLNMKNWLKLKLENQNQAQNVLELFCGNGNFTEIISGRKFNSIHAVESSKDSIIELEQKKLINVYTDCFDLFNPINLTKFKNEFSILVLDPPREGFKHIDLLLEKLKKIKSIFYISCNVDQLLYDLKKLNKLGFEMREIQPIDLFPMTPHLEVMVELFHNNK